MATKAAAAQTPAGAAAGTAVMDLANGTVSEAGVYELQTADGKSRRFEIGSLPEPLVQVTPPNHFSGLA